MKKSLILSFVIASVILIFVIKYSEFFKNGEIQTTNNQSTKEEIYTSNTMKNVNYSSKDAEGNEYIIYASEGEIDYSNTEVIFLKNVRATIKLVEADNIKIFSDFGRYNINNFDTIFSKNVLIKYKDNTIKGGYLDFSLKRNSMIISKNVIYTNPENTLEADNVEIEIDTRDTKISMFEKNDKINIKNKK
tara:strand:+ start:169 stop:738 length:570 start_codon:yes stop_codon:yes gene_type:complete